MLKQPLTAILIAQDQEMRRRILTGDKKITIREGLRDYKPGPTMICCHLDPWVVKAEIESVRHCKASDITLQECQDDGFMGPDHLLEEMKAYYPSFNSDSDVTIIRWGKVEGRLVQDYQLSIEPF